MNATLLIHSLVRQTMVLVAALATAAGQRAPLAAVADQVFADLVRELKEQGLGNKVIADMFGMALRTYHTRVSRLASSGTDQGRSLWEAVLEYLQESPGQVLRAEVLQRFSSDDESVVRGVLRDLTASGLVYRTGRGDATAYRATEGVAANAGDAAKTLETLLWVTIHQRGPVDLEGLADVIPADDPVAVDDALERLVAQGLVERAGEGSGVRYESRHCVIPYGDEAGWEAALFDHYQALVTAMVTKLRLGKRRADLSDRIGGSTFVFDVWQGHPHAQEALGWLAGVRRQGSELRKRIEEHNRTEGRPASAQALRVTAYVGQSMRDEEEHEES